MIIYTRCKEYDPPRSELDVVFTEHDKFLAELRMQGSLATMANYRGLLLELQPGDGTKYRVGLQRDGDHILLACSVGSWCAWLDANHSVDPYGLADVVGRGINPLTAALCCDVYNVYTQQASAHLYPWSGRA